MMTTKAQLTAIELAELKAMIASYNSRPHYYAHHYPRKHMVSIAGSPHGERVALYQLREFFEVQS